MHDGEGWRLVAAEHAADLLADERRIQRRLKLYGFLSRAAVVLGIVAPILAGSTVLASLHDAKGLPLVSGWPVWGGVLTLVASMGVALHKGLECDRYHGKCRQALAELRSLATGYGRLLSGAPIDEHKDGFQALETRLDKFYRDHAEVLPLRATRVKLRCEAAVAS